MAIIYTIGHSTRDIDDFIHILEAYEVKQLVDVRSVPRSRYTPQFNSDSLASVLNTHGIVYQHLTDLGGLRHTTKASTNMGWHNTSFRGYADYMQTDGFEKGISELIDISKNTLTAIMCAEAVPWRCHRSMIGDALLVRKFEVIDIFDIKKTQLERLTDFASVDGTHITYPALD